ncbi:MAG: FtsL-like putative cell division protein [Spirosomataceae bacterium]
MAKNTFRDHERSKPTPPKRKRVGLFTYLDRFFNLDRWLGGTLPINQLFFFFWLGFLFLLYIGAWHNADRLVRETFKLRKEINELRADYTTRKSTFMKAGKQSEVAKRVEKLGLYENKTPPEKIVVKE